MTPSDGRGQSGPAGPSALEAHGRNLATRRPTQPTGPRAGRTGRGRHPARAQRRRSDAVRSFDKPKAMAATRPSGKRRDGGPRKMPHQRTSGRPGTGPRLPTPGTALCHHSTSLPTLKMVPQWSDLCHTHVPEQVRDAGPQPLDSPVADNTACLLPSSPLDYLVKGEHSLGNVSWYVSGSSLLNRSPHPTQLDVYVWPSAFCAQ